VAAEDGATRRRHLPWLAPPSSRPPLLELPPPPRSPLGFARRRRARCGGGGGGEHQRHAQDAETEQLTAQHTIVGGHEAQEVIEEPVRDEDASLAGSPRRSVARVSAWSDASATSAWRKLPCASARRSKLSSSRSYEAHGDSRAPSFQSSPSSKLTEAAVELADVGEGLTGVDEEYLWDDPEHEHGHDAIGGYDGIASHAKAADLDRRSALPPRPPLLWASTRSAEMKHRTACTTRVGSVAHARRSRSSSCWSSRSFHRFSAARCSRRCQRSKGASVAPGLHS
jgi:hypothetical protein